MWRDDHAVIMSEFEDSPRSYDPPARMVGLYLRAHQPNRALQAFRTAAGIYDRVPWLFMWGADAAFAAGQPAVADSALRRLEQLCNRCQHYYYFEAAAALFRRDSAVADSILARMPPAASP